MTRVISSLLALSLVGCTSTGLSDASYPTGSSTIAASSAARTVYAVHADEGTVSRYDTVTGAVSSVAVGAQPARVARIGDRLLVTLRGERGIAVLRDDGSALVLDSVVPTGAEPFGIVASEDGTRVYVALSTQDQIDELDGTTLAVLRSWRVDGQPRWLALHPSERAVFVASAFGGGVARIALDEVDLVESVELPDTFGPSGELLTRRITGDPSISADGRALAVPALYVDNVTPVTGEDEPTEGGGSGGYGSSGLGVSRLNPSVILVDLTPGGGRPIGAGSAVLFAGFVSRAGQNGMTEQVRSYPSSVTFAPDGGTMWATLEGSSAIAALSTAAMHMDQSDSFQGDTAASTAGFAIASTVFVGTDEGPRGVAFIDHEDAYVQTFADRTVATIKSRRAVQIIADQFSPQSFGQGSWRLDSGVEVTPAVLPVQIAHGRHLFYSATDTKMAGIGAGVSCATCHSGGRNDGVTWTLPGGARNTPSLAGQVRETAPFTWTEDVPNVETEVMLTSQGRMGGAGLSEYDAASVAAFIDTLPRADVPDTDAAAAARGRLLFEREDVGCAECHAGAAYTDGESYAVLGTARFNTPGLRGIAATAPYFHDGSAKSLDDVLVRSDVGIMGDTSMLTAAQRDDLLAYLASR